MKPVPTHSVLKSPGLYFRTVRNLKLSQFYYLVVRRLLPTPKLRPINVQGIRRDIPYKPWFPVPQPEGLDNEFRFINETKAFDPRNVDWVAEDQKKLWRYNLHYFDFLQWDCYSDELKQQLIDSWIESCPVDQWISWDPYAVSMRIVNWIKYFLQQPDDFEIPQHWLNSLINQANWLTYNMEYQILANHLIKNAKALVFAGVFFDCEQSKRFLDLGCKDMLEQLREQFLDDHGHFERSHMYHQIVVEDYLDLLNLAETGLLSLSATELEEVREATGNALDFYVDLCAGDNEIQLFNDSTFGIVEGTDEFLDYAKRVLNYVSPDRTSAPYRVYKPESGYFGYRSGGDSFLIDCGPVGPDYQPGHAHCDNLSFELSIDSQRIVVDSGNYTYEHIVTRYENRQTAAHNTVRVDGQEQSEVWERWRVGRRAYPISAELSDWQGERMRFRGSHDGYTVLPGKVVHEREVEMSHRGFWTISDKLTGGGEHLLESYIHLHPDVAVRQAGERVLDLLVGEQAVARLTVTDDSEVSVEDSIWCPEFGLIINNKVVVMRKTAALPAALGYTIEKL